MRPFIPTNGGKQRRECDECIEKIAMCQIGQVNLSLWQVSTSCKITCFLADVEGDWILRLVDEKSAAG
jgi:hypothetical protein